MSIYENLEMGAFTKRAKANFEENLERLYDMLPRLKGSGLTMLVVEQNVQMALAISDYAYVLSEGRIEIEGQASDVRRIEVVRQASLGV